MVWAKVAEAAPAEVVASFVEQGWSQEAAEEYVRKQGANHAIGDELTALKDEYIRLRSYFKKANDCASICLFERQQALYSLLGTMKSVQRWLLPRRITQFQTN